MSIQTIATANLEVMNLRETSKNTQPHQQLKHHVHHKGASVLTKNKNDYVLKTTTFDP